MHEENPQKKPKSGGQRAGQRAEGVCVVGGDEEEAKHDEGAPKLRIWGSGRSARFRHRLADDAVM